jgi:glycosyltransferase involved in cell wall biosynthesis
LRILIVSRGVLPAGRKSGGAEFVAFELAKHLAARGEEVVLVSDIDVPLRGQVPTLMSIMEVGGRPGVGRLVRLVPVNFPRWVLQHLVGNLRVARRARALIEADGKGFDAVHVHGALATILLRRTVRALSGGIPLIYTEHDSTPWSCRYRRLTERAVRRSVYRLVNLRACRAATRVVVNYAALADELAHRTGMARDRFTMVRNATGPGRSPGQQAAGQVKARHGLDRYYLFVGSLVSRKGPDVLLRALAEVGLPCVFIGDGPMRAALERLASRSGIADRVVFTGALERHDVHQYYAGAEALVLPSVSEGVPLVAIEALGAGVPVVASNLTGVASIVRDRENGLLVAPGDAVSLVSALSLFEKDAAMRATLRSGALRSSRTVTSWPDVVNQLCELYQQRPVPYQQRPAHEPVPGATAGRVELSVAYALSAEGFALRLPPSVPKPRSEQVTNV